jgi:hypothetical protein
LVVEQVVVLIPVHILEIREALVVAEAQARPAAVHLVYNLVNRRQSQRVHMSTRDFLVVTAMV